MNIRPTFSKSSDWIKLFYTYTGTPEIYHRYTYDLERGEDEKIVYDYIKKFSKNKKIVLIDLGIGTGRELKFLKEIKNIKKIIGIDYSKPMLDFCKNTWEHFLIPLKLIQDDFRNLKNSKKTIQNIESPKIFTLLFGTINNTTERDRLLTLKTVKKLMTKDDRLIIDFSKVPEKQIADYKHPWIKFKERKEELSFYDTKVFIELDFFWKVAKKHFGTIPQFFYDKKTRNIVITISGVGNCFFSHRYTKKEIGDLIKKVGLKIEMFKDGKEMYISIIRNNQQ